MNAFLEKINGEWLDEFVYISVQPLQERGFKVIPFDGNDLDNTLGCKRISPKYDICIGSVEAMQYYFKLCGVEIPKCITYPIELRDYLRRRVSKTTFGELTDDYPYFIKPANDIKKFTGDLIEKKNHLQILKDIHNIADDYEVYKCAKVNFITEYRVFVSKGVIYGIKHYKGDFTKFINVDVVNSMIKDYQNCPSAYVLDVGLTDTNETLLVEVNDMWAVGSYGLYGKDYSFLSLRRLREIFKAD